MVKAYRDLSKIARIDAIQKFGEARKEIESILDANVNMRLYDEAVSAHQGKNAARGRLCNDLAAYSYGVLFSAWNPKVEQRVRMTNGKKKNGKRDIDVLVELPKGDLYVSVTTVPQERKDETWKSEFDAVVNYRSVMGVHKPFCFICLMYEYQKEATLQANLSAIKRKMRLMGGRNMEITAVMAPDHHAEVLSRIMGALI